ncbi:MAG: molybdate ABC transporter permease subunit [Actinomycetes bacterium]
MGVRLLAAMALAFMSLPVAALLARAPWSRFGELVTSRAVMTPLRVSLLTSSAATVVALALGVPLAWMLARGGLRRPDLWRVPVLVPVLLPPVVAGVALLAALGRNGLVGGLLEDWFGLVLPFSTAGVVVAQTFVALPFVVLPVEAALRNADRAPEDVAAVLGANRWRVLREVGLPSVAPAVAAGALLAWARAVGEFGATVTFAGSLSGRTQTLPTAVYEALEYDRDAALVLSVVLVVLALVVLVGLRARWWPWSPSGRSLGAGPDAQAAPRRPRPDAGGRGRPVGR